LTKKKKRKKETPAKTVHSSHSFFLANWFGSDIAIDLGTTNIIVYRPEKGNCRQ
jgi:rod shape-determining protein MreB